MGKVIWRIISAVMIAQRGNGIYTVDVWNLNIDKAVLGQLFR